jgi:transposase InsO family protein
LLLRPRRKRGVRYVRGNDVPVVTTPNERWSIDFVHDRLSTGRAFRVLTVVDDFSRECVALEVDFRFPENTLRGSSIASRFLDRCRRPSNPIMS